MTVDNPVSSFSFSAEFKYFRDGATLVISLDGLNWLSKRRWTDKGVKKRCYFDFYHCDCVCSGIT